MYKISEVLYLKIFPYSFHPYSFISSVFAHTTNFKGRMRASHGSCIQSFCSLYVFTCACRYSRYVKTFPHCWHSGIFFTVRSHMFSQGCGIPEGFPTLLTFIRFLPSMCPHVYPQVVRIPEGFPTLLTFIGFHPSVWSHMSLKGAETTEGFPT